MRPLLNSLRAATLGTGLGLRDNPGGSVEGFLAGWGLRDSV